MNLKECKFCSKNENQVAFSPSEYDRCSACKNQLRLARKSSRLDPDEYHKKYPGEMYYDTGVVIEEIKSIREPNKLKPSRYVIGYCNFCKKSVEKIRKDYLHTGNGCGKTCKKTPNQASLERCKEEFMAQLPQFLKDNNWIDDVEPNGYQFLGRYIPQKLRCPKHGVMEKSPSLFLNGKGKCLKCFNESNVGANHPLTPTFNEMLQLAEKAWGIEHIKKYNIKDTVEALLTQEDIKLLTLGTKIPVFCDPEHGGCGRGFKKDMDHFINRRQGCPYCVKGQNKSNQENLFISLLEEIFGLAFERWKKLADIFPNTSEFKGHKNVDAYCFNNNLNILVDYHGSYFHGDPRTQDQNEIFHGTQTFGDLYQKTLDRSRDINKQSNTLYIEMHEYDFLNLLKTNKRYLPRLEELPISEKENVKKYLIKQCSILANYQSIK